MGTVDPAQFTTLNGNNMPLLQFENNEAYGAMQGGFTYWWINTQDPNPFPTAQEKLIKNLKIWQLTTLVKAARLSHLLQLSLPLQLHTTQLILAQSIPISISFKTAERKFDVDGAYNIRYEIIKKRIDKVRIKDSTERLTQPGAIAIV